jgi:hypothetical protein
MSTLPDVVAGRHSASASHRSDLRAAGAVAPRSAREPNGGDMRQLPTCPGRPRSRWAISVGAGPDCDRCLPDRWEIQLPTSARLCPSAGDRDRAYCVVGEGHRPFKAAFSRPIRAPGALVEHKRPGQSGTQQRPPEPRAQVRILPGALNRAWSRTILTRLCSLTCISTTRLSASCRPHPKTANVLAPMSPGTRETTVPGAVRKAGAV